MPFNLFADARDHQPAQPAAESSPRFVEALEGRIFMHTGPLQVTSVIADNRGEILIQLNQPIRPSNVNTGAIQMYTAGPDGILANADDTRVSTALNYQASINRIVIRANDLPANVGYRIKLASVRMETADGDVHLDGEFRGVFPSGNGLSGGQGVSGGNFEFQVKHDLTNRPLIRWSTSDGVITTRMLRDVAPRTVANFQTYMNARDYDNIFITRNVPGFIIQGGSLQINAQNTVIEGPVRTAVQNEFNRSNTRGTLAMAKQGNDPNSATNQFFFNLGDNSQNLDNQNGGFTVFAEVTNNAGLAVMDAIAGRDVVALHNPLTGDGQLPAFSATGLTDVPVRSAQDAFVGETQAIDGQGNQRFVVTSGLEPNRDLVTIRRIAQLMRVVRL